MRTPRTLTVVTALAAAGVALSCGDGGVRKQRDPEVVAPACGDGTIDEGEACDGSNFAGNTCATLGFDLGTLSCNASCELVTSQCVTFCGNGQLDLGEQCDGTQGALACGDFGYKTCTDGCQVDTLHCRTSPFEALAPITQTSGGPAILTDLSPEGPGDLVTAVPGFYRLQTQAYETSRGFVAPRMIDNQLAHTPALPLAADVDGDGHLDLASINADGSADRYRYLVTGTFVTEALTPSVDGGPPACVASWVGAGKLDADSADDLVALGCTGALLIFPGGATPAAPRTVDPGVAITAAALFDTDGDGLLEVLAATSDAKLLTLSAPEFQADASTDLGLIATQLAAADFDHDGDADLVLQAGANLVVLENTGSGYAQRQSEAATALSLIAADLDLDGAPDYAWMEAGAVQLRRNLGSFVFKTFSAATGAGTPIDLSAGDLEGDGDLDLAATVRGSGSSTITYVLRNKVR